MEHTLIDLVNQIQSNFEKGMFTCGILFYSLKKAFDTVDQNILWESNYCSSYNPDEMKTFCQIEAPGLLL